MKAGLTCLTLASSVKNFSMGFLPYCFLLLIKHGLCCLCQKGHKTHNQILLSFISKLSVMILIGVNWGLISISLRINEGQSSQVNWPENT